MIFLSYNIQYLVISLNIIKFVFPYKTTYWELNSYKCQKTWKFMESVLNITTYVNHYELLVNNLEICDKSSSVCCNNYIEKKLNLVSLREYQKSDLLKSLSKIKLNFINHSSNFDTVVKEIIDSYEFEFQLVANKSNENHYNLYSNIFDIFFDKLKKYYGEYPIEIDNSITGLFFNISLSLLNLQSNKHNLNHKFDINCIVENINSLNMYDLKQLNIIEDRLIISMESLKLFTIGLTKARDMMIDFYAKFENPSNDECKKHLIRMNGCQSCLGDIYYPNKNLSEWQNILIKPCYEFCLSTLKSCFFFDVDTFDPVWKSFLELMSRLANSNERITNIENTMNNLKLRLINMISNFRSNSYTIIRNLFSKCGSGFTSIEKIKNRPFKLNQYLSKNSNSMFEKRDQSKSQRLSEILSEMNNYFKKINQYWSKLVETNCKTMSSYNEKCWNGSQIVPNKPLITKRNHYLNEANDFSFMRHLEGIKSFNKKLFQHLNEITSLYKFQQPEIKKNKSTLNRNQLSNKKNDHFEEYYETDDEEDYYEDESNINQKTNEYGNELEDDNYDEEDYNDKEQNNDDEEDYNIKDDYDYAINYEEFTSTTKTTTTNKNKLMRMPTKLKNEPNMIKSTLNDKTNIQKGSFINSYMSVFTNISSSSYSYTVISVYFFYLNLALLVNYFSFCIII